MYTYDHALHFKYFVCIILFLSLPFILAFFRDQPTPPECMSITRNQYNAGEGSMACEKYLNKTYNN